MSAEPRPEEPGRIITVFAAKGGCGKTTLVTNLAAVLNAEGGRRVCIVDLDLAFGDVASMLSLEPGGRRLDDAGERLDADTAWSLATPIWPGLDAVLAPVAPGGAVQVPPSLVTELLVVLSSMYDYVVVDTPAQFSAHVLAALDTSQHHVLLCTPERPALQNLRLTLDMLDLLPYRGKRRSVVLNRCQTRTGLTAGDIEGSIKCAVAAQLPTSRDVSTSINRGVPLAAAAPSHRFSQAVLKFVEHHVAGACPAPPVAPAGGTGPDDPSRPS